MVAFVRKNLAFFILKHTSSLCSRSPVSSSLSPHFFSSATQTQLGISPTISDILMHKYDFPPELASRVASKLTYLVNPEKADSVLSFLKETGFSNTQLMKIVNFRPQFLAGSVEDTFKPKIKIFQELGFSLDDICQSVSSNPRILNLSVNNNIVPKLSLLNGLFGSNKEVARVVRKCPCFLSTNLKNTMLQNVKFLEGCGIPMKRIRVILHAYPRCFSVNPQVIRKSVEKAKEIGLNARSNAFIYAIPTLASMSNEAWEVKLQGFRDSGFSDSDIATMFSKAPQVFMVSIKKVKKIIELLLATGKFDLSSIVSFPISLSNSVEKRYIPRLQILGILESRKLIEEWPGLGKICTLTDAKFFEEFIMPYLNEVIDVDIIKSYVITRMKSESLGKNQ